MKIRERMAAAAARAGRDPASIRLVAVAKNHPAEQIARARLAGQASIGENYVQELLAKQEKLADNDIDWHFIGRLQSNKIRQIVGRVSLIHSVDRPKLLREIQKRSQTAGIVSDCLLEVNVGEEESKGGANLAQAADLLDEAQRWPNLRVLGLMSIPPFLDSAEALRPYHRRLAELAERLRAQSGLALPELSMGMSMDFEVAIEEGATIVRVGTDIFGPRDYT